MYVSVRVIAGSKEEKVEELPGRAGNGGRLTLRVKAPAERGLANRRATELVARHFKLPVGKVRLVSGHRSPSKIFSVDT